MSGVGRRPGGGVRLANPVEAYAMSVRRLALTLCVAVTGGCGDSQVGARSMSWDSLTALVGETRAAELTGIEPRVTVGSEDGSDGEVIGLIAAVARTREGHLVVLDERMQRLILLDSQGRKRHEAGGAGDGPGEFRVPTGFEALGGEEVRVLDQRNRRVSVYRVAADSLEHIGDRVLPTSSIPRDACTLGSSTYVMVGTGSSLVEVVGANGRLEGEFGDLPPLDHVPEGDARSRARSTLATGKILCLWEAGLIVATYNVMPDILAFDRGGRLVWRTELQGFRPLEVSVVDRMGRTFTQYSTPDPTGLHNSVVGIVELDGVIAVQLAVLDWVRRTPGLREIDTRFLDPATGRELARRTDIPQLGPGWGGEGAAFVNEPYPRAAMYRMTTLLTGEDP